MTRTFSPKPADVQRDWVIIDATDIVLGRLASTVAALLRGKREFKEVKLDWTRPAPRVSIIGEFWAMTTEGDGNYQLQKFLEKEEMPWVHWWDNGPESKVLKTYRVRAFPTMYLIDHTGTIKHKWVGAPGNDKLDAAIDELVKAAEKAKG